MNTTELVAMFDDLKSIFSDAVVSVAVAIDANTTVTVEGLRSNTVIARAIKQGMALENSTDLSAWVPVAGFADVSKLCGCEATITDAAGVALSGRLLPVTLHALGGIMRLQIGEWGRVTA